MIVDLKIRMKKKKKKKKTQSEKISALSLSTKNSSGVTTTQQIAENMLFWGVNYVSAY